LPRIKASEIKVVKREIKEGKESMWLPRSWVQIIPPSPLYLLSNYGIEMSLILTIVGQNQSLDISGRKK
jgi:hypothetical protein